MSPRRAAARRTVCRFVAGLELHAALHAADFGEPVELAPDDDELAHSFDLWEHACLAGIAGTA